jgi:hypothetical protein
LGCYAVRKKFNQRFLKRRFGELPNWAVTRLQRANIEQLEAWAEQIFDAADVATLLSTALD